MDTILKASYGDRQQRDYNAAKPDRVAAAHIEHEYRERRLAKPKHEVRDLPRLHFACS